MNNNVKTIYNPTPEQIKITLKPYQKCLSVSEHHNEALKQTYYSHIVSEYGNTCLEGVKRITVPKEEYYKDYPIFEYGKNKFILMYGSKNLESEEI
jgi:hypothetical protein